jgi:DHA2 family multidrug resistance protein-like MFS transporter
VDAARDTLGGAVAVAQTLPGELATAVVASAQVAFVDALHLVAVVAAVGAVITAILAVISLWKVPARSEPPAQEAAAPGAPVVAAD